MPTPIPTPARTTAGRIVRHSLAGAALLVALQVGGCCCGPTCGPDVLKGWSCSGSSSGSGSGSSSGSSSGGGSGWAPPPWMPDGGPRDAWTPLDCPDGGVRAVAVGHGSVCAVRCDDRVLCWGAAGVLPGIAPTACEGACITLPTEVVLPPGAAPREVAVGGGFACVVREDGELDCWGRLGERVLDAPTRLLAEGGAQLSAVEVRAGGAHVCARDRTGPHRVFCAGDNAAGQLGDESTDSSAEAVRTRFRYTTGLATGDARTLTIRDDFVFGVGENESGEVTWPPSDLTVRPTQRAGVGGAGDGAAVDVAATRAQTCALLANGQLTCWGRASALTDGDAPIGACLDGASLCTLEPRVLVSPVRLVGLAGDASAPVVLAWTDGGELYGAGESEALLGPEPFDEPAQLEALGALRSHDVALGAETACAIVDGTRELVCWGRNDRGQLGRGHVSALGERVEDTVATPPAW